MASLFSKDPGEQKTPLPSFSRDRIEDEIAHLKKRGSVRDPAEASRRLGIWVCVLAVLGVVVLFLLDPVLYSFKRGDAIRAYLYLHNFGSDARARALAATGILTPNEVEVLNRKQGPFQDYFPTPDAANQTADGVIRYMKGVQALQDGRFDRLDLLGKIRYELFVRWGLHPPVKWRILDPDVGD